MTKMRGESKRMDSSQGPVSTLEMFPVHVALSFFNIGHSSNSFSGIKCPS